MNHLPCGTCCHCTPPVPTPPGVNDSADLGSSFCQWWFKITIARISGFRPLKYMWDEVMWSVRSAIQTSLYSLPLHTHTHVCMHGCVLRFTFMFEMKGLRELICVMLLLACTFLLLDIKISSHLRWQFVGNTQKYGRKEKKREKCTSFCRLCQAWELSACFQLDPNLKQH